MLGRGAAARGKLSLGREWFLFYKIQIKSLQLKQSGLDPYRPRLFEQNQQAAGAGGGSMKLAEQVRRC
jgi:hypothetical protein